MIEIVIRHIHWDEGKQLGEFLPSEVNAVVDLIKNFGVFTAEGNEDLVDYSYHSSRFNVDEECFEIIVE